VFQTKTITTKTATTGHCMIKIPKAFRSATVLREGTPGRDWITGQPGLAAELQKRWNCVGEGPIMHGAVGIVVGVRGPDLPQAVLRLSYPHEGNRHEPVALMTWAGRGAVRPYEHDDLHFAMLLERAGTQSPDRPRTRLTRWAGSAARRST
jgi:streptomycin 6-kinase